MEPRFFGQYLVAQGLVTLEQLEQALTWQRRQNRLVGEMAVEAELLTPWQVRDILALQKLSDLSFGEIAVAGGFVSKQNLEDLLFKQRVRTVHLGEALLCLGYLDHERFSSAMADFFSRDANRCQILRKLVKLPKPEQALWTMVESLERSFMRLLHLPLKAEDLMEDSQEYNRIFSLEMDIPTLGLVNFRLYLSQALLALTRPEDKAPIQAIDLLDVAGHYFRQALDHSDMDPRQYAKPIEVHNVDPAEGKAALKLTLCSPMGPVGLWAWVAPR